MQTCRSRVTTIHVNATSASLVVENDIVPGEGTRESGLVFISARLWLVLTSLD